MSEIENAGGNWLLVGCRGEEVGRTADARKWTGRGRGKGRQHLRKRLTCRKMAVCRLNVHYHVIEQVACHIKLVFSPHARPHASYISVTVKCHIEAHA